MPSGAKALDVRSSYERPEGRPLQRIWVSAACLAAEEHFFIITSRAVARKEQSITSVQDPGRCLLRVNGITAATALLTHGLSQLAGQIVSDLLLAAVSDVKDEHFAVPAVPDQST